MSLSGDTRQVDGMAIADMSARLPIGEPALSFRQALQRFVDDGRRKCVLNLGDVS